MSDWSFSNSEMPTIRLTELIKAKEEAYQQGRADLIDEIKMLDRVTRTEHYEWSDGTYNHYVTEDVEYIKLDDILELLKEQKNDEDD